MCDAVNDCLAEKEADVIKGGSSDGEALLAAPNNVPLVWTQAVAGELWRGEEKITPIRYFTISKSMEKLQ